MFERCMESIKKQTYPNIITIVHTDDPRDEYVTGDIIIKGHKYPPSIGGAPYNLYCNRLLESIPSDEGFFCFLDDDDEYINENVIETLVKNSKEDHINVGKVIRWDNEVFPKNWGQRQSFQTECFFVSTKYKHSGKWWSNKGGDHYYTRYLIQVLPINWIENLVIAKAQKGKGHGKSVDNNSPKIQNKISVLVLKPVRENRNLRQGEISILDFDEAIKLEKSGFVKITYPGMMRNNFPVRRVFNVR